MSEEDKDVAADTNAEVEETTNSNEHSNEESVDLAAELERERKARLQITARAKKAEEELKELKGKPHNNSNSTSDLDELKLTARGLSDEEIEQAKVIAKGKGISLSEAVKDPLFVTYQSDLKAKQRREEARIGASKGSGESEEQITGLEAGSSREDHKKAWNKVMKGK